MRSQVPDDVYVVLKQPQVHAQRIVVIQIAESAFIHQLADFLDRASEQKGVIDHDLQFLAIGKFD